MNDCIFRNRIWFLAMLFLFPFTLEVSAKNSHKVNEISLTALKVDNAASFIGIDSRTPQFSWELKTSKRNVLQTAYQLLVADEPEKLVAGDGNIWNSGKVASSASAGILYRGKDLESRKRYYWKLIWWGAAI
ncbi:glycoside hydrolase family 78 protein [Niabella hibiscisoli]|uniref:glycoside hydrolase family 78 protein n=1 Tax=Niabella hibiscisoli TaxID=1825928 RepID=UPI001F0F9521|nr:hypothetical protein [Niabella hibiscisoli]MCH5719017.1 hypothetical protein [Niabella hibiscisoli]